MNDTNDEIQVHGMNEQADKPSIADRKLGDEWEGWAGDLDESHSYDEKAGLFASLAALSLLLLFIAIGFILYMIEPRLGMIHPLVLSAARVAIGIFVVIMTILSLSIVASVFTGRDFLGHIRLGQVSASRILPLAVTVAGWFGVSRDRLGNSFVSFSNAIIEARRRPIEGKTIILIPRCLSADMKKAVRELGEQTGIGVYNATGGGQARKIVREQRPSAVIGVACERDLVSGIKDVAPKMPVIGVANKRPEGPCKNTLIDLDDLKAAIRTLTGAEIE